MLSARENFKFAFLSRCIESGITTPAEIHQVVKQALDELAAPTEKAAFTDATINALGNIGGWTAAGLLAAPPILGAGIGYAAARAGDVDDADIAEVKRQEVIDELRRQSKRIRSRREAAFQNAAM
jgi:hypothetical protein